MSKSAYSRMPAQFFKEVFNSPGKPETSIQCAGFELQKWRCTSLANHLIEWLPEYALPERELDDLDHTNSYNKLQRAAYRVYTSEKIDKRGEIGEIALHAICRSHFGTTPISERVFYKSRSNDVIKSFDLVHAHVPAAGPIRVWLGESKLYSDADDAVKSAVESITAHLEAGFLQEQKMILGPQIPPNTPRVAELRALFSSQASIDLLLAESTFVVGIASDSASVKKAKDQNATYISGVTAELNELSAKLFASGLHHKIEIRLVYLPIESKAKLVKEFDRRLKGLQP